MITLNTGQEYNENMLAELTFTVTGNLSDWFQSGIYIGEDGAAGAPVFDATADEVEAAEMNDDYDVFVQIPQTDEELELER